MEIKDLLTIIIPCKDEEKYIYNTLQGIACQIGVAGTKVIIADAHSTDNTIAEISQASVDFKNLDIELTDGGPVGYARNTGAMLADTPFLLFIDADCDLIDSDILVNCLDNKLRYDVMTCKVRNSSSSWRAKFTYRCLTMVQRILPETFCTGCFFFISKKTFTNLGMFDEEAQHSEDYLLSRKIPKSRFKIINRRIETDDRRLKKMGYIPFLTLVIKNYLNRNNKEYFNNDVGYWEGY